MAATVSRLAPSTHTVPRRPTSPASGSIRRPGLLRSQAYAGCQPAADAQQHGMRLEVVKLSTAKRGFVLLPRRWMVERSFAWMACFRRLARDCERLAQTLAGLHFVAFAILLAHRFMTFMAQSA